MKKTLLTNELIKEREEDITFEELEILDYQQKRFGPNGDLMIQKRQLIQPIQDQIFAAVQDIAATKQYDFIFDKSADVVMLYSADRFDLSEQIIRTINRSSKREQAQSRKEVRDAKDEDVVPVVNEGIDERKKALEDKKAARAAESAQRRQEILEEREAKKLAAQNRRDSIIEARNRAKEDKLKERENATDDSEEEVEPVEENAEKTNAEGEDPKTEEKNINETEEEGGEQTLTDKEKRQQELELRKQKILEDRKKAKEARENKDTPVEEDTGNLEEEENSPEEEEEEEEEEEDEFD